MKLWGSRCCSLYMYLSWFDMFSHILPLMFMLGPSVVVRLWGWLIPPGLVLQLTSCPVLSPSVFTLLLTCQIALISSTCVGLAPPLLLCFLCAAVVTGSSVTSGQIAWTVSRFSFYYLDVLSKHCTCTPNVSFLNTHPHTPTKPEDQLHCSPCW